MNTEIMNTEENNKDTFYIVHMWMLQEMQFETITEVLIYAYIYGFYMNDKVYYGTHETLQKISKCKPSTCIKYLNQLVKNEYLIKEQISECGYVKRYSYTVNEQKLHFKYRKSNIDRKVVSRKYDAERNELVNTSNKRNSNFSDLVY